MLNIVFGSIKKIAPAAIQQFDFPSMKVEKNRGKGTTRRVLFNKSACRLLELDSGGVQELLFGFAQPQQENEARLFVVNTAEFIKCRNSKNVEHQQVINYKNVEFQTL